MATLLPFAPILAIAAVTALGLWIDARLARRARAEIHLWAESGGYRVLAERRSWTGGPFWYLMRQGHVFRVTLAGSLETRDAWFFIPYPLALFKRRFKWVGGADGIPALR